MIWLGVLLGAVFGILAFGVGAWWGYGAGRKRALADVCFWITRGQWRSLLADDSTRRTIQLAMRAVEARQDTPLNERTYLSGDYVRVENLDGKTHEGYLLGRSRI